jgi:hypothetical protein
MTPQGAIMERRDDPQLQFLVGADPYVTTGIRSFAECHKHSAKLKKTLGEVFAECNTRQSAQGKKNNGKGCFAECPLPGTRRRVYRVPRRHLAKQCCRDGRGCR